MLNDGLFQLCPAQPADLADCIKVLSQGRAYQQSLGFTQWPEGYPAESDIKADIMQGLGYVIKENGRICAYFYIDSFDKSYQAIQGAWHSDEPYLVIHRVAIADGYRGAGLSSVLFGFFEKLAQSRGISNLRIDTHENNIPMQRVLAKNGYTYCGTVMQDNGLRWAYDKIMR